MFHALRGAVRIIAIVLLAWTAVDLAFPNCCLNERIAPTSTQGAANSNSDTVAHPQLDIDDCFCCARCLDTGFRPQPEQSLVAWVGAHDVTRHIAARPASLDHPPQIL